MRLVPIGRARKVIAYSWLAVRDAKITLLTSALTWVNFLARGFFCFPSMIYCISYSP